jgi:hypothetical protein
MHFWVYYFKLKITPSPMDFVLTFGGFNESEEKGTLQLSYFVYSFICRNVIEEYFLTCIQTAYCSAFSIISV